MKKRFFCIIITIMVAAAGICNAASYTLPEKMHNQLAIGSGLKGSFRIVLEGEKFNTPFLKSVSDADFSLRGISSGKDFHYYIFQTDEGGNQSAVSELYRKDGICYLRSDMVQGKILALPTTESVVDSLFPAKGENPSFAPVLLKLLSIPEKEYDTLWKPVISRYQNDLEMWLADFTVQADVQKQDNGSSALVFTYVIPVEQAKAQMLNLFMEIIKDSEASELLDTVMTSKEKEVYANPGLGYYYQGSLDALDLTGEIKMMKRVSALGDVISSSIDLPLDEKATGYVHLSIASNGEETVYTLMSKEKTVVLALPSSKDENQSDEYSIWFTSVSSSTEDKNNRSVRIDIQKTGKEYNDEEERSHLENNYVVSVVQDDRFLPEGYDRSNLADEEDIRVNLNLHYFSKYSQNSATTLEINAEIHQSDSSLSFNGSFKTAAPWLFMPFEVIDPLMIDPSDPQTLILYFADWVSNAPSMIHHTTGTESGINEQSGNQTVQTDDGNNQSDATQDPEPQTQPESSDQVKEVDENHNN